MLLYNNRWICLLPFARKPDPRRVSKQVSRELPQAWLFGLVRLAPQAERKAPQAEEKRRRQANSARRRPENLRDLLRSPCSSRSVFARAALAEQRLRPLVVHKGPPREGASAQKLCGFFFLSRRRGHWGAGALRAEAPPPKQQAIRSSARRRPFWGGAGRRPPCPNGALLEKK